MKGYRPEHLELENRWILGHEQKAEKLIFAYMMRNEKRFYVLSNVKQQG